MNSVYNRKYEATTYKSIRLRLTDKWPLVQKYTEVFSNTEANKVIQNQIYSPAKRSPWYARPIQHQYWPEKKLSAIR